MKKLRSFLALLLTAAMLMTHAIAASGNGLPFDDIDSGAWYAEYVEYVYENNLMMGKGDGIFAPQAGMTRAEMATLLSRMAGGYIFGLGDTAGEFTDIDGSEWHADYIGWAVTEGLLKGYDDGSMKPNAPVLRQEIVTIFSRFADFLGLSLPSDSVVPEFDDAGDIAPYAVPFVEELAAAGIIVGSNGRFNPMNSVTRAEAAKIIKVFHELMADLPAEDDGFVPVIRFAVVSDTHVNDEDDYRTPRFEAVFESAYRYADSDKDYSKLDAVVVVGDLTPAGKVEEYEVFNRVVSSLKREETEFLAVMGNHDWVGGVDRFEELVYENANFDVVVGGYHFVGISPNSGSGYSSESVEFMGNAVAAAAAEDPEKPIFTFQHHHIKDTVYVSPEWYANESEELHAIYSQHSQVVNFSGHSHGPVNNPTSMWQGDYTALGTGTLSYFEMETGMSYGTIPPNESDSAQYYIIEVDANNTVRILPYNLLTDSFFRTPSNTDRYDEQLIYYIDKPSDKTTFRYADRAATAAAPCFEADDKLSVSDISSNKAVLTIPQAKDSNGIYSYDIEIKSGTYSYTVSYFAEYYFEPMPSSQSFIINSLLSDSETVVTVTPVNCFGIKGEPISTVFTTAKSTVPSYSSENPVNFIGTFTNFDSMKQLRFSPVNYAYGGSIRGDIFVGDAKGTGIKSDAYSLSADKGYDGSKALELWSDDTNDMGVYLFATNGNKNTTEYSDLIYLRVWVDFTDVSFEKASFGLVTPTGALFSADDAENVVNHPFWYMPEGEDEWKEYNHGLGGCFGEGENASVNGFKGWLAFPVRNFFYRNTTGNGSAVSGDTYSDSSVAGVYMNWKYADESYIDSKFYLDEIALVKDFRVFDEYKK